MPDGSPRPLVLTQSTGATVRVAAADARAQTMGVRVGLTLGQAHSLATGLLALPYEPARDQALLTRLADWALRFSPVVQPLAPDTLLLDITGCAHLFGWTSPAISRCHTNGEENLARQALGGLLQQGFEARAAIADTVGAAWAIAVCGRMAFTIVAPGCNSAQLAPLPPAALRLDVRTVERLDAVGVRTIGDLLMLPRTSLPARFGELLVQRMQEALGERFEGVTPHHPVAPPSARAGFEFPVCELGPLRRVIDELFAGVVDQLLECGAALRRLDCTLYYESANLQPAVCRVELSRASRSWPHVATLLHERIGRLDPTPGVNGLLLVAAQTQRWRPEQPELDFENGEESGTGNREQGTEWEGAAPAEPSHHVPRFSGGDPLGRESLLASEVAEIPSRTAINDRATLVDTLANRLGHAAVVRPRLIDDHQPEFAYRYVPALEAGLEPDGAPTQNPNSKIQNEAVQNSSPPRPVLLLPRPVPVRAIAVFPDGPPTWFAYDGVEQRVVAAAGPERIETAWWRGPDVRRDYFRVTSESGEQFWLYRDADERRWYVHGVFA